jgi:pimeloyl-ACP methyl ester carboxylesterase
LFLFLFTSFVSRAFAVDYFTENFDIKDDLTWNYFCNYYGHEVCDIGSTNVFYDDGSITLNSNTSNFPVVISKNDIFPREGDFYVRVKFRYPTVTHRGVGLGIGFTGPRPYYKLYSQFGIWNDTSSHNGFKFYYNDFSNDSSDGFCSNFTNSTSDTAGRQTISNIGLSDSLWHLFEIYKIGNDYSVYIDRDVNKEPIFTSVIRNNCIPRKIWFGNFIEDGGGSWTSFSLDEIGVSNFPTPTETPTPTATLTEIPRKKKIFILPGLGASWNSKAIVYGQNVDSSDWKMTPFVNNYDGLIELLNENGLEEDKDYFVWNYDWRKSIENIKNDFNTYFNSKNLSETDDIYLVGHSLGGVVARLWTQDNSSNENIKKVIALGSPNLGSLDAYSVWNGGKFLRNSGLSSVVFNIILGLQNKGFVLTDLNKIRNYASVVKDLLPVFDYAMKNGKNISWRELESHNDFLKNQNDNFSRVSDKFKPFVGVGFSTPNVIDLKNRSLISKSLGLWPDGEIKNYFVSIGDGTVLKKSSGMSLSNVFEVNSEHGELPAKSVEMVADEIGLENKNITFNYSDNFSDSFIIFVGSPVTSLLKCGNDIYQENDGFILVKDKDYIDCDLNLSPTDNGTVHVVLGNLRNNIWNYFEDEVTLGNSEKIKIDYKKAEIKIDVSNKQLLRDQIKSDLEKLGLKKAVKFLDKNDLGKVVWYVFEYREKNGERIISQRILDNLFILGSIISQDKVIGNSRWLNMYAELMEKTLEIKSKRKNIPKKSVESLIQLQKMENKINQMIEDRQSFNYLLVTSLALGYGGEILSN